MGSNRGSTAARLRVDGTNIRAVRAGKLVGAAGFEPTTTSPPGWRSPHESITSTVHHSHIRHPYPLECVANG